MQSTDCQERSTWENCSLITELKITNSLGLLKIIWSTSPPVNRDISPQTVAQRPLSLTLGISNDTAHTASLGILAQCLTTSHCARFLPHIPIKSVPVYLYTLPCNCWIHVPLCWEIATILWPAGGCVLIAEVGDKSLKECEEKRKKDTSLTKERTCYAFLKTSKILQHTGDTEKVIAKLVTHHAAPCSVLGYNPNFPHMLP